MFMDINIEIYIRQLKEFFKNDEEARKDMFMRLDVDMGHFFKLVREQAEKNFNKDGEVMLSGEQMATIMSTMMEKNITEYKQIETNKIFKTIIKGFQPMCMN